METFKPPPLTMQPVTFSINYNPSSIPASGVPYPITYAYAGDTTLTAANNTSTTLGVNSLPVILTGTRAYDGTNDAAAGILSVSNKVGERCRHRCFRQRDSGGHKRRAAGHYFGRHAGAGRGGGEQLHARRCDRHRDHHRANLNVLDHQCDCCG